ncbi:MAG: hypothetical protein HY841_06515 [Bacteroidetes bacterium]|nr:hypothetical protein [Bacteroidota bacterium]
MDTTNTETLGAEKYRGFLFCLTVRSPALKGETLEEETEKRGSGEKDIKKEREDNAEDAERGGNDADRCGNGADRSGATPIVIGAGATGAEVIRAGAGTMSTGAEVVRTGAGTLRQERK